MLLFCKNNYRKFLLVIWKIAGRKSHYVEELGSHHLNLFKTSLQEYNEKVFMNYKSTTYVITVNATSHEIKEDLLSGLDLIQNGYNAFHSLNNDRAYSIEVINADFLEKKLTLSINGNKYEVSIADAHDQMVKEMGLLENTAQKMNEVYAPMPGLIMDVMVEDGQEIKEGTPLIVLSAMKMENVILSQGDGTVKSVNIKKEDTVEKGQLIMEMK